MLTNARSLMDQFNHWLAIGLGGVVSLCLMGWAWAAEPVAKDKASQRDDLFGSLKVLRIQIEIPRAGMNTLRGSGWGNGQERPKALATVREGDGVYTNVTVHLKGSAGSFRPIDANPCLTLNFDQNAGKQTFHGLRKLSLNNSVQDRSFLSEKICRELFEAAGVPVPRAAHAVVELNGRLLGLYVLTEGFNKQFLKRYFTNTSGNLYDGGFVQDITSPLEVNTGDNPRDHSGLKALLAAAREPDTVKRMARLEQALDLDRFLSLVAMEVLLCHWDGYAMNRNNWRIFHDLEAKRMVFFPHGLDQMFGVERSSPDSTILPHMEGLVARAVLETREGRRRYLERMAFLYTNVFQAEKILRRVDEIAAGIRPALETFKLSPQAARRFDAEVQRLKDRISQRDENLKRQLTTLAKPVPLKPQGAVQLTGWKPRVNTGAPVLDEPSAPAGVQTLHIAAPAGSVIGSWRTRLLLEPGDYTFVGRVQTKDVRTSPNAGYLGAGLRIGGATMPSGLSGNSAWQEIVYPFQVTEFGAATELVCELRALRGEAWFDQASLKVLRVK